jgi:hypothetical protein
MVSRRVAVAVIFGVGVVTGGCASSQEWDEWMAHPSHFASGTHMSFSLRNTEGSKAKVTRADIEDARQQGWWGKAVTVSSEAIIQR